MSKLKELYNMLEDADLEKVISPKDQRDDEAVKLLVEWVCYSLLDKLQADDYLSGDKSAHDYWKGLKNKRPAKESLDELITSILDDSDQEAFAQLKKGDKTWAAKNYYRMQVENKDHEGNKKRLRLVKALEQIVEMLDKD
mgnify:CR=1 FL=1